VLRTRVITGLILGALFLGGIFLLPPAAAVLAFGAVFCIAAWEWAAFASIKGLAARAAFVAAMALIYLVAWRLSAQQPLLLTMLGLACLWWLVAFCWLTLAPERHQPLLTLLCGLLTLPPAFVALMRLEVSVRGFAPGPQLVLFMILMVASADIGAYFAGRRFGRRKLAPRVSPGKTWEGAAGGLVGVALMSAAGAAHFHLPVFSVIAFGCCVGIFSVIGDLTESMFKRAVALKDSGTLLPGHGGLLDRLDSVTAAAPLYALGLFGSGVIR
jgi:phosphatidate cytidylyltransferase